jgi:hypothetical protein
MSDNDGPENKLPQEVINQLQGALKKENKSLFWSTLAGSSVIAALIGVLADRSLEAYKAHLASDNEKFIEKYKVELQQKAMLSNAQREAYSQLATKFIDFDNDLRVLLTLWQFELEHPHRMKVSSRNVKQSYDKLVVMTDDLGRNADSLLIDPNDTEQLKAILASLGDGLPKNENATKEEKSAIIGLYENKLKASIEKLKIEIRKKLYPII